MFIMVIKNFIFHCVYTNLEGMAPVGHDSWKAVVRLLFSLFLCPGCDQRIVDF